MIQYLFKISAGTLNFLLWVARWITSYQCSVTLITYSASTVPGLVGAGLEERQEVELFPLFPGPAGLSGETDGHRPTESSDGGKVWMWEGQQQNVKFLQQFYWINCVDDQLAVLIWEGQLLISISLHLRMKIYQRSFKNKLWRRKNARGNFLQSFSFFIYKNSLGNYKCYVGGYVNIPK